MSDSDVQVIHHRLTAVEKAVEKIGDAVQRIADYTQKLAILEERHAETRDGLERCFEEIKNGKEQHDEADRRLKVIEVAMPGLRETRRWVVGGILALVGMVGLALIGLVVLK